MNANCLVSFGGDRLSDVKVLERFLKDANDWIDLSIGIAEIQLGSFKVADNSCTRIFASSVGQQTTDYAQSYTPIVTGTWSFIDSGFAGMNPLINVEANLSTIDLWYIPYVRDQFTSDYPLELN